MSIPDEVPTEDAAEQRRDLLADTEAGSAEDVDEGEAPLESNPADWQEQQQIVEDPERDL